MFQSSKVNQLPVSFMVTHYAKPPGYQNKILYGNGTGVVFPSHDTQGNLSLSQIQHLRNRPSIFVQRRSVLLYSFRIDWVSSGVPSANIAFSSKLNVFISVLTSTSQKRRRWRFLFNLVRSIRHLLLLSFVGLSIPPFHIFRLTARLTHRIWEIANCFEGKFSWFGTIWTSVYKVERVAEAYQKKKVFVSAM